jgi:two-component system phosphate regulon sensor histidine kinase PhoR
MNENRDGVEALRREIESLRSLNESLSRDLAEERRKIAELDQARSGATASEVAELPGPITEFEETLRRLVQRTAMFVQAEKCVIMVRDRETGDLIARSPAWGLTDEEVHGFRVPPDQGVSGSVFRSGQAAIVLDPANDPRAIQEHLSTLKIRNGITVPLQIERRDDENRVVDRVTIGVLHCFNKRYGGDFISEDVSLLERLSRNAAAVIANAQMYQEVVEEKQRLVHTLESLTAGLILINHKGRIAQMNAQARAMFQVAEGVSPIGRPFEEVLKNEKCTEVVQYTIERVSQPKSTDEDDDPPGETNEITLTDADHEQYIYQVHAAEVRDGADNSIGTVVIFNDITDIRNVERMKTEFVSIVSHELRTPLTPMKGFIRTLLDGLDEDWYSKEDRREFYGIIEQNVDRLKRLIDDLLNVSRIEKMGTAGIDMNWAEVDIRKAVEEVLDTQKGRTDRHTFVIDLAPEHFMAETDPDKIQNILQNFVSNAIKYAPNGGEVRIIGRLEAPSEEFPMGSVLMGVKDQGLGMSERDVKKIGEKFFQSTNKKAKSVGGTGIGLYLVHNLIKAHHGYMWVDSVLDKGSTFWFRIPLKQPEAVADASDAAS